MASLVYVMPAEVAAKVGNPPADAAGLARAAVIGTRVVARIMGATLADIDDPMTDATVEQTPCDPTWTQAALFVAIRSYRGADAVFGYLGAEVATAVKSYIPDVELMLMGQPRSWGIA